VRTIVISAAISLLMVVALVNFVSRVAEYNEIQSRKEQLLEEINMSKDNIEELEYWLEAPMDDDYIMKFAREKLELYRADEIVFAGEAEAK
jgi:cell division protein FtsB